MSCCLVVDHVKHFFVKPENLIEVEKSLNFEKLKKQTEKETLFKDRILCEIFRIRHLNLGSVRRWEMPKCDT